MVRYPLGGMMSYVLQYLLGFWRLGHDVYFAEKAGYAGSCYDPSRNTMGDDCTYGVRAVRSLLERFGLQDRWCYVDASEHYFGLSRASIEDVLRTADLFVDMGTHGAWLEEATGGIRVLLDGEPGFTQMKMAKRQSVGERLPGYDFYYTAGCHVGTPLSSAPTARYSGGDYALAAHRILRNWTPAQATWNEYSTGNAWTSGGALGAATDRVATPSYTTGTIGNVIAYIGFDVTADVQNIIDSVATYSSDDGWQILNAGAGNDGTYKQFVPSEGRRRTTAISGGCLHDRSAGNDSASAS